MISASNKLQCEANLISGYVVENYEVFLPIQNNRKDTSWKFTTKESKIFVQQNPSSVVKNFHISFYLITNHQNSHPIHNDLQKEKENFLLVTQPPTHTTLYAQAPIPADRQIQRKMSCN